MHQQHEHTAQRRALSAVVTAAMLLASIATASAAGPDSPPDDQPAQLEGFWPTSRMIESLIHRWAAESAQKYDLRPDQRRAVEDKLLKRWSTFLNDNRVELQPLVNEFVEARIALDPPTADQVADWASRAIPVYQRLRANLEEGQSEIRSLMNADQQARFDAERAKKTTGLQVFGSKLKRWSVGNFKQREWWRPPRGYQAKHAVDNTAGPRRATANRAEGNAADAEMPKRVTRELHAWEKHVADFCDRFDLDRSQRNAAQSMLREMSARARDHVRLRRDRIAELEGKIKDPAGVEETELNKELAELYGPLDRMFRELDDRLNKLPTPGQRLRAQKEL